MAIEEAVVFGEGAGVDEGVGGGSETKDDVTELLVDVKGGELRVGHFGVADVSTGFFEGGDFA